MYIVKTNKRKGHKFLMSNLLFSFSMSRVVACILRIALAKHPHNVRLAIAAAIFVAAGVVILFIVNLIFTHRILRASHPHFGWHPVVSIIFKLYIASIVLMLIAIITCTIQGYFVLSHNIKRIDRDVQLVGNVYFTVAAFLPLLCVLLAIIMPRRGPVDKFGIGRYRSKIGILLIAATLLTLGAAFRTGTLFLVRPKSDPAWYHSRPCFYLFNFTIELCVLFFYAVIRVDRRFHIPNGAKGHGSYSLNFKTEEEVFDDEVTDVDTSAQETVIGKAENIAQAEQV